MDEKKTAPALETQGRQHGEGSSIIPPADAVLTLTKKDLYCIARILQGIIYGGNLFQYCDCCPDADDCHHMARQNCTNYFSQVRPKLQNATGVYLGLVINADLIRGKVNSDPGTDAESPVQ